MKVKTKDLAGMALDWAVAKSRDYRLLKDCLLDGEIKHDWHISGINPDPNDWVSLEDFNPTDDWALGGPFIAQEQIDIYCMEKGGDWDPVFEAEIQTAPKQRARGRGRTPLIAIMRCFVASKLGDEADVPEELI